MFVPLLCECLVGFLDGCLSVVMIDCLIGRLVKLLFGQMVGRLFFYCLNGSLIVWFVARLW